MTDRTRSLGQIDDFSETEGRDSSPRQDKKYPAPPAPASSDCPKEMSETHRELSAAPKLDLDPVSRATGSGDRVLSLKLLGQAGETAPGATKDVQGTAKATMALLQAIGPQNPLEGVLATQMVGVHNATMHCLGRVTSLSQVPEVASRYADLAGKLARTFTAQIEALNRLRGHGQQKIVVEHVRVEPGGQAFVGNMSQKTGD